MSAIEQGDEEADNGGNHEENEYLGIIHADDKGLTRRLGIIKVVVIYG